MTMASFFDSTLGFVMTVIAVYVMLFGLGGVIIARKFGKRHAIGFSVACILGPLGWVILYVTMSGHMNSPGETLPDSFRYKKVEDYL